MIWANLLHLSYNMWMDREDPDLSRPHLCAQPYLRFDEKLWRDLLRAMADAGLNAVVIDVGDGVAYESHPEIAVEGAWSADKLRSELAVAREMGIEPIPKLNFSTTHDIWLGPYSRRVSTPEYYDVCRDLIDEVVELFDNPRLFHLGMDEETAQHQVHYLYAVMRQHDLWWDDLLFLVDCVEKHGARAWIWSDYIWHHRDEFLQRMPQKVLQSNWYYGADFDEEIDYVRAYLDLEAHGYDQIPTGSNWSTPANFGPTVDFCSERIAPQRLIGFLQTTWRPTLEEFRAAHLEAISQVGQAIAARGGSA